MENATGLVKDLFTHVEENSTDVSRLGRSGQLGIAAYVTILGEYRYRVKLQVLIHMVTETDTKTIIQNHRRLERGCCFIS